MAYEELDNWIDINAPGLNKRVLHTQVEFIASSGSGGGGGMMVTVTGNNEVYTLSKTWKEIFDCMSAGGTVFLKYDDEYNDAQDETVVFNFGNILAVTGVSYDEGMTSYIVYADSIRHARASEFTASTPNDYPSYDAN